MRRTFVMLTLVVSTLALGLATVPAVAAEEGAAAVEACWAKAVNAGDAAAAAACYAEDAVAWYPDEPEAKGRAAILALLKGMLDANTVKATLSDTHAVTLGTKGTGWGRFTMTLTPKAGGAPMTMTGRFSEVVEKRNGKWVYVLDHASADPPPPATKK